MGEYISYEQKAEKPSYEEVSERLLTCCQRLNLDKLLKYAESKKIKPHWYAANAFNVKSKGRIIFRFHLGGGGNEQKGKISLFFTVAHPRNLDRVLLSMDDGMRKFYFKHLRTCTNCNPNHGGGKQFSICGNMYHICAEPEMKFYGLEEDQIEYLMKFIDVRISDIKNLV